MSAVHHIAYLYFALATAISLLFIGLSWHYAKYCFCTGLGECILNRKRKKKSDRKSQRRKHTAPGEASEESRPGNLIFGSAVKTTIVVLFIGTLNLFGIEESSDRFSASLFLRIASNYYPIADRVGSQDTAESDAIASDPQDNPVSVMLLTENDLREADATWPPPLSLYAEALLEVIRFEPRAIFVDVIFLDNRNAQELAALNAAIAEVENAKIPLFLATTDIDPLTGNYLRDGGNILTLGKDRRAADGKSVRPAQLAAVEHRQDSFHYCLTNEWGRDSAALALFRVAAEPAENSPPLLSLTATERKSIAGLFRKGRASCRRVAAPKKNDLERLSLFWPITPAKSTVLPCNHALPETRPWAHFGLAFVKSATDPSAGEIHRTDNENFNRRYGLKGFYVNRQTCPPVPNFSLRSFYTEGDVPYLIYKRILLIGTSFFAAEDLAYPPTHTPMPGVFVHATALLNLFQYKTNYMKPFPDFSISLSMFLTVLFTFLVAMLVAIAVHFETQRRSVMRVRSEGLGGVCRIYAELQILGSSLLTFTAWFILIACLLLIAAFVMYFEFKDDPLNFAGISLGVVITSLVEKFFEFHVKKFFEFHVEKFFEFHVGNPFSWKMLTGDGKVFSKLATRIKSAFPKRLR